MAAGVGHSEGTPATVGAAPSGSSTATFTVNYTLSYAIGATYLPLTLIERLPEGTAAQRYEPEPTKVKVFTAPLQASPPNVRTVALSSRASRGGTALAVLMDANKAKTENLIACMLDNR